MGVCVLIPWGSVYWYHGGLCTDTMGVCVLIPWGSVYWCHGGLCTDTMGVCVLIPWGSVYWYHGGLCTDTMGVCVLWNYNFHLGKTIGSCTDLLHLCHHYWVKVSIRTLMLFVLFVACWITVGNCYSPWAVAYASELPPACRMAKWAWKNIGKGGKTTSRLPTVANHRAHSQLPNWYSAEIIQGTNVWSLWKSPFW